jgi:predicted nucleic acid-binding protein
MTAPLGAFTGNVIYLLRPRDGLHLAAMQQIPCLDLASTDPHFDRVPHIQRFTL